MARSYTGMRGITRNGGCGWVAPAKPSDVDYSHGPGATSKQPKHLCNLTTLSVVDIILGLRQEATTSMSRPGFTRLQEIADPLYNQIGPCLPVVGST